MNEKNIIIKAIKVIILLKFFVTFNSFLNLAKKSKLPNNSSQILLGNKKKFKVGSMLDNFIAKIKLSKNIEKEIINKYFLKYL